MTTVLIVISAIAGVIGIFTLSQATAGVGGIAVACLFGIYARIYQAYEYNKANKSIDNSNHFQDDKREIVHEEDLT